MLPTRSRVTVPAEDITLELRLAPRWSENPAGLEPAFFDVEVPTTNPPQLPLEALAVDGGLLRRGLEQ